MPNEKMTAQQVLELSKEYELAGNEVSRFHNSNFQSFTAAEHKELYEKEESFRKVSRALISKAESIVWENLQTTLKSIREATDKMRKIRAHLLNVKRALTFATAAITLGTAILTGNPIGIATASLQVVDTVNTFRDEDDEAARAEDEAVG